jgi:hypothetical protein
MGKVITINKKIEFQSNIDETVKAVTAVEISGFKENVETKIIPLNQELNDYKVFKIEFFKKYNIEGNVYGKAFNSILRKYSTLALVDDEKKFVLTIGNVKGIIPRAAFRRLRNDTQVKCASVDVDLIKAIPEILRNIPDTTVNSGWFSELGVQLRNAWLQGHEVNENPDWIRFLETTGSKLKNVQFKINDEDIEGSSILISLSSRGFIFTTKSIADVKYIEIADNIIRVIDKPDILLYDGSKEDYEEDIINVDELEQEAEFTESVENMNL